MSVTVSITFSSLEEAIMNLAKLRGSDAKVEAAPAPKPEKPAKVEKPAASPSGATQAAAPATPDTAASGVPYETVVKAISAAAVKDKPKVVAVLAQFSAKTGKDLKAEQYAEFLAALEKAMTPAEEESLT